MRKLTIALLIISITFLISSITVTYLSKDGFERKSFPVEIIVTQSTIGFDLGQNELNFGKVALGGDSTRSLQVENNYNFPIRINLKAYGETAKYLDYQTNIIVKPKEKISIPVTARVPKDEVLGIKKGEIELVLH